MARHRRLARGFFVLVLAGAPAANGPLASVPRELPRLEVVAAPAPGGRGATLERAAREVAGFDRRRLLPAMRLAGLERAGAPIRVVLAGDGSPEAAAVPPWVAGYAIASRGLVVLFPARSVSYPDQDLESVLHHEVAHVLVGRAAGGRPVPRWFDEGVAMAAGRAWRLEDSFRFALERLRAGPVPLSSLDARFAGGYGEASSAYAVAGSFVRELLARHGPQVTGDVLREVRRGLPFPAAFARATGVTLPAAEASFWRRATSWQRSIPFWTSSFVLWLGLAFLVVWAFARRRRKSAELERRWAAEEEAERRRVASRLERLAARRREGDDDPGSGWVH